MIIYNSELYHYGMPRRSGRYKWGSGKDPYHHGADTAGRKAKADYKAAKKALSGARRKHGLASYKKAVYRHNMKASMNYPGVALSTIAKRSGHPGRDLKKTVNDRINNTYAGKKINKDYFNTKNNLNNKKEAAKTAKEAYKQTDQYKRDRRKKIAAIAAGTTVAAAGAYLATHPEARQMFRSKSRREVDSISKMQDNISAEWDRLKNKSEQLKKEAYGNGVPRTNVGRVEVPRTHVDRVEVPRTHVGRVEVPRTSMPRSGNTPKKGRSRREVDAIAKTQDNISAGWDRLKNKSEQLLDDAYGNVVPRRRRRR